MQQHLHLVDETFDSNFTQEYYLSIQFSLDGFSFSIRDGLQNKYIYLFNKDFSGNPKLLHRKLKDIFDQFEILQADFKSVQIMYVSPGKMLLIPDEFLSDHDAVENYKLNLSVSDEEELNHLPIKKYQSVLQFAISSKVKRFFEDKYPGVIIQNELVNYFNRIEKNNNTEEGLHILLYKNQLTIALAGDSIRFCNSFKYRNDNDLLYYILHVAKMAEAEQNLQIRLNGRVNKRSAIYHHLKQYFKNVVIENRSTETYYSYLFDQLPDARFVNLLNNHL
jgi:hypothetical protein